jgi:hypothetical protein
LTDCAIDGTDAARKKVNTNTADVTHEKSTELSISVLLSLRFSDFAHIRPTEAY